MNKTTNIYISNLERVIVNWATPLEGLINWPLIKMGSKVKPKLQIYIDEYGVFKGLWESKINDYGRLIKHASQGGKIPGNILQIYDGTPCGYVMNLTYKLFRE